MKERERVYRKNRFSRKFSGQLSLGNTVRQNKVCSVNTVLLRAFNVVCISNL